jgi:DNA-binding MarR family transcriptional regulator
MPIRLTEAELAAWQALLHAHHDVMRVLDAELRAEHGLNMGEYDVLVRLARVPDHRLRMTELASRVMISPSGLTRVVDGLVEANLVRRERGTEDGRVNYATLTREGHELVRRAARTHLRGIRQHFTSRLSERQLREIASGLEVITGPHKPH